MLDLHHAGHCMTRGDQCGKGATGVFVVDGKKGGRDAVQGRCFLGEITRPLFHQTKLRSFRDTRIDSSYDAGSSCAWNSSQRVPQSRWLGPSWKPDPGEWNSTANGDDLPRSQTLRDPESLALDCLLRGNWKDTLHRWAEEGREGKATTMISRPKSNVWKVVDDDERERQLSCRLSGSGLPLPHLV